MDDSPLGKLPPELRNRIYTFAMSEGKTITFAPQSANMKQTMLKPIAPEHQPPQGLSLAATCRQMRQECSALFYASNDFAIIHDVETLKSFTKVIGRNNTRALRSVTVKMFANIDARLLNSRKAIHGTRLVLRTFGLLANRYGWRCAKIQVKVDLSDDIVIVELDVANLGKSWLRFDIDMMKRQRASLTPDEKTLVSKVKREVRTWRKMLVKEVVGG